MGFCLKSRKHFKLKDFFWGVREAGGLQQKSKAFAINLLKHQIASSHSAVYEQSGFELPGSNNSITAEAFRSFSLLYF